ncbi:hypothetical protein H6P81_014027 [Aristolochia fimbriata]|uniref:Uncharacterized protein n=1 Tax=Aristolochia fimbriata TaxID=158543 RepID=A0AAV7EGS6_ARIFI|nr:hypothetical protein H6P81_014027 [Aristolochia fimbriata]
MGMANSSFGRKERRGRKTKGEGGGCEIHTVSGLRGQHQRASVVRGLSLFHFFKSSSTVGLGAAPGVLLWLRWRKSEFSSFRSRDDHFS